MARTTTSSGRSARGLAGLVEIARDGDRTCDGCGVRRAGYGGEYRGAYFQVEVETVDASRTLCEGVRPAV